MVHGSGPLTVTENEQLAVVPDSLIPMQVTIVAPSGKAEPDGGLQMIVSAGQLSVVGCENVTTAAPEPAGFSVAITLAGQMISHGAPLVTVTLKLQLARRLFVSSCASQLTVVVPSENVVPDGGVQTIVESGQPLDVGSE